MTHQREGIRKAPSHVFIVEDEAVADEVRTLLKQRGHELSPVASETPPPYTGGRRCISAHRGGSPGRDSRSGSGSSAARGRCFVKPAS